MKLVLMLLMTVISLMSAISSAEQVPFAQDVDHIYHYHRHQPGIATSGKLYPGAIEVLEQHEFKLIIDLRHETEVPSGEGEITPADEQRLSAEHGIRYVSLPVTKKLPDRSTIKTFQSLIADSANHPMLVHCGSGSRAGFLWALAQIEAGKPRSDAILEGRTIGMKPALEDLLAKGETVQGETVQ